MTTPQFWLGYELDIQTGHWHFITNNTVPVYLDRKGVEASARAYRDNDGFEPEVLHDSEGLLVVHPVWWKPELVLCYQRLDFQPPTGLPTPKPRPAIQYEQRTVTTVQEGEAVLADIGQRIAQGASEIAVEIVVPHGSAPLGELFERLRYLTMNRFKGKSKYKFVNGLDNMGWGNNPSVFKWRVIRKD
jgi:hypothetical protein